MFRSINFLIGSYSTFNLLWILTATLGLHRSIHIQNDEWYQKATQGSRHYIRIVEYGIGAISAHQHWGRLASCDHFLVIMWSLLWGHVIITLGSCDIVWFYHIVVLPELTSNDHLMSFWKSITTHEDVSLSLFTHAHTLTEALCL